MLDVSVHRTGLQHTHTHPSLSQSILPREASLSDFNTSGNGKPLCRVFQWLLAMHTHTPLAVWLSPSCPVPAPGTSSRSFSAKLFDPCSCPPTASLYPSTHGTSCPEVLCCALHGKHVPALQESEESRQIPVLQKICIFYASASKKNPMSWCVHAGTTAATATWCGTRARCTTVMRWCSSRASRQCPVGRTS